MNIYDIEQLKKNSDGFFELTTRTFKSVFNGISYNQYIVQQGEEMRADLVCQSIYGNIKYIDIILNVNNISNPLNIKEGTILFYPSEKDISSLRFEEPKDNETISELANPEKSTRTDNNRQKYVEQNYSLPPTIMKNPTDQVLVNGDKIELGNGLFNK